MPQSAYAKDEKVLCFHHDILYDAKILDVRHRDADRKNPLEFLIHYKGWKSTWDDWVLEDRLRKANDENRMLATNIRREAEATLRAKNAKPAAKKRAASDMSSLRDSEERGSVPARISKRARENEIEKEDAFHLRPSVRIVLPDALKSQLVDDWERVTKNYLVVDLPAKIPIVEILEEWCEEESARRTTHHEMDVLKEIIAGIEEYFNVCLGKLLLYRFERPQYRSLKASFETRDLAPSKIYGAEHLLRLFSKLPELLAQTNMDITATRSVREDISKMSMWLSRNSERFFTGKYIPALEDDDLDVSST
ncbi:hypothetical protein N7495_001505 [Penicillium taxi]|uniref:uncharacterized protein n=1 Tax=Penicillium taxi TaxID=168475 RepID=UPI002544D3F9|nr:uncharacterized protein N7495_001505 [Penicillium taxi]KAJ5908823.1 hypothetical protein N7495_001505 [Penicillium taxi]